MALAPGTYVEDGSPLPPPLEFISPSGVLLMGESATGPWALPTAVSSVGDYAALFGGAPPVTLLDHGVHQFFGNGGKVAVIIRLPGSPGSPAFQAGLIAAIQSFATAEALDEIGTISVPGLAEVATLHALQTFAKDKRKFLLIDGAEASSIAPIRQLAGMLRGDEGINSALLYPWLTYAGVNLPPGPAVAGLIARKEIEQGCWRSPAGRNSVIVGATGLVHQVGSTEQDILNPENICCLRADTASRAIVLWGSRTLASQAESEWKYIPVRRLALALQTSLATGLTWVAFEPNAEPLWASLRLTVGNLLHTTFRQGALQGATPSEAYFVQCGLGQTMTPADVSAGHVFVEVGFAPLKPAEFIVLRFGCTAQPARGVT